MSKITAKTILQFVCQECGSVSQKWLGKCNDCGAWNSFAEEKVTKSSKANSASTGPANLLSPSPLITESQENQRIGSGINELDRVLGGGLVKGSAVLIGGEPGIGKSTLLLQLTASLVSSGGAKALYISGEESVEQIRLRAKRLNLGKVPVSVLAATNISEIVSTLEQNPEVELLIIDSIQTMYTDEFSSSPGTVSQIRAAAYELINLAKKHNIIIVLVGHITKDGQLAGPKVLEHMVDVVLYFEGDRGHQFRIVRATKNRFGGINEIGIFEMSDVGLIEVTNPSALFLSNSGLNISGSSVFAGLEGTRPLLVEIQALISPSPMATPRRAVIGWDINRLAMMIAILNVRYGLFLADKEVYLNIVGGLRITEPAADLAIIAALISASTNIALPKNSVIFGETGLAGEVRGVSHTDTRIREAAKLGFSTAIIPAGSNYNKKQQDITIHEVNHIRQLKQILASG